MNMTQLNPPIPIEVKGQGAAEAIAIFDYGPDQDIMWLVFLMKDGQSMFANGRDVKKAGYDFN